MSSTFLKSFEACYHAASDLLSKNDPVFLSRIGGSDTAALVSHMLDRDLPTQVRRENALRHRSIVGRYNGFYDKTDRTDVFEAYCETLLDCYKQSPQLVFSNFQLISMYFKTFASRSHPEDFEYKDGYRELVEQIGRAQPNLRCYPYHFIERVVKDEWTLFHVFSSVLQDKKVLVISPFAESVMQNFPNRKKFFKNYVYPEFDLLVYNTPITYAGLPANFYPDGDWFETLKQLKAGIANYDFDVALLSCGSYAMPLGVHIEKELGKKAIYVGGVLQLFFGIMGRRYENKFFLEQINEDEFIVPVEKDRYLANFTITDQTAREAFGAYF